MELNKIYKEKTQNIGIGNKFQINKNWDIIFYH